ncbi:MAG: ABC transporter ATP-binding protein [Haloglomus sp.]
MTRIELDDVTKTYGSVTALDGVSLSVEAGSSLGLIGTNGAGKTTLFRLLVGHERPDAGTVRVGGRTPRSGPAVRQWVGYLPEHAGFDPRLTGREILTFHARVRGVDSDRRDRRVRRVLRTVGLADAADRRVGGYSNGMNRRLGLATLLVGSPQVLLLDEPTASLDPAGVEAFHDLVARIREDTDITLVVTSHVLPEVERLCDDVAVLHEGRLLAEGDIGDLEGQLEGTATISLRLRGPAGDELAALRDRWSDVAVERPAERRVDLVCAEAAAFDVLADARERLPVDSFEVHRPGLDDVFSSLLGEQRTDATATTNAESTDAGTTADAESAADTEVTTDA